MSEINFWAFHCVGGILFILCLFCMGFVKDLVKDNEKERRYDDCFRHPTFSPTLFLIFAFISWEILVAIAALYFIMQFADILLIKYYKAK